MKHLPVNARIEDGVRLVHVCACGISHPGGSHCPEGVRIEEDRKAAAESAIDAIFEGRRGKVTVLRDGVNIYPPGGGWGVTFNHLQRLSTTFGTCDINLDFDPGWGGTDVTPGDPSDFTIRIRSVCRWPG